MLTIVNAETNHHHMLKCCFPASLHSALFHRTCVDEGKMLHLSIIEMLENDLKNDCNSEEIRLEVCDQLKKALAKNLPEHMKAGLQKDLQSHQQHPPCTIYNSKKTKEGGNTNGCTLEQFKEKYKGVVLAQQPKKYWSDVILPNDLLKEIKRNIQSIIA